MESIELELPNEVILEMALEAHKLDITLNEYMVNLIKKLIEEDSK